MNERMVYTKEALFEHEALIVSVNQLDFSPESVIYLSGICEDRLGRIATPESIWFTSEGLFARIPEELDCPITIDILVEYEAV